MKEKEEVKKEFDFNKVKEEMKSHFESSVNVYKDEIKKIRTGRSTTLILEDIKADYYNSLTPIKQLATLSVKDASTVIISPWDKGAIKSIEKAIISSNLGVGVIVDGNSIRVNFPPLTEERKKELIKLLHGKSEEAKVALRNVRHKYLKLVKEAKESFHVSEDLEKRYEQEIDKIFHEYVEKIDTLTKAKEKEIMEV